MLYKSFDTETYLIEPGRLAPRLVCLSWHDGVSGGLLLPDDAIEWFKTQLDDPEVILVGHSVSFDVGVMVQACPELMPLVWREYDAGRILDTRMVEQLYFIEKGWYSEDPKTSKMPKFTLAACVERLFNEEVSGKSGDDVWRLRYHELWGLELSAWPPEAKKYALLDAHYTWRVWAAQQKRHEISPNLEEQCRSDWSLHLVTAWGMRTDPVAVDALEADLTKSVDAVTSELLKAGIYKQAKNGKLSKDMKVIRQRVTEAYNGDPPKTPKGSVSTAVSTFENCEDELLRSLASISNDQKLLSTYVPVLRAGTEIPLMPRYFMAASGRTTCRSPNIQNQPRKGGVRECFVPREGYHYVACDYHVAELCSLAQVLTNWFGSSRMADVLNSGKDLHLATAAAIMRVGYSEAEEKLQAGDKKTKSARQMAKALNFGLPGGLGAATFVKYAKDSYGVEIDQTHGQLLKANWLATFPEMQQYFEKIGGALGFGGEFTARQLGSDRLRGGLGYCDGCNTYFQGLTADGARKAVYEAVRHTLIPGDPLFGSRVVAFIHDEIIIEAPIPQSSEAAKRLSEIMIQGMKQYLPDMVVRATPHIMERWFKDAEAVYDETGRLVPWRPDA